ncbi:MAG TPA: hypothetical protein VGO16_09955 [Pseudonocardiaceae bacterium]|nr:hypothetical protein [Pseudonocardiaceae bacterium]
MATYTPGSQSALRELAPGAARGPSRRLPAIGGILAVSRQFAAHQSTGGSDVLLFAIAAAVIGGVSL